MERLGWALVQLDGAVIGLCSGTVMELWKSLIGRWCSLEGL